MKRKLFSLLMLIVITVGAQNIQQNDSLVRKLNNLVKKSPGERFYGLENNNISLFKGRIEIINKTTIRYDN